MFSAGFDFFLRLGFAIFRFGAAAAAGVRWVGGQGRLGVVIAQRGGGPPLPRPGGGGRAAVVAFVAFRLLCGRTGRVKSLHLRRW
jgi:hypothetical protein